MKFRVPNKLTHRIPMIMRKCSFAPIFDRQTGKHSFVRKPTQNRYPRFHLYVEESPDELIFDLHIDQSKTHYSGQTAHKADYEGKEIKNELIRIYQIVSEFMMQ